MKQENRFSQTEYPVRGRRQKLKLLILAVPIAMCGLLAISCNTVSRQIVMPPQIPGATFVGSGECVTCHENITRDFAMATHARLTAKGTNAVNIGCEACHGPGSKHSESGGEKHTIINPDKSPEVCFQCHLDKRGEFNLPSHHPVLEGRVTCTACHDPHKGPASTSSATALIQENDQCASCHIAQRGPFVFPHEAMREGCTSCHNPHGSVNAKMLKERNANLCLKCHFQRQTAPGVILIGEMDHTAFLRRSTCWGGGCHEAVHGSQVNSSLRY